MAKTNLLLKPVTGEMLEMLMDIHERELMKMPPLEAIGGGTKKGLLLRDLVTTYDYKKKENISIASLRLTEKGYNLLNSLK